MRRPKKRNKTMTIVIRLTAADKRALTQAAEDAHLGLSTWARAVLLREAARQGIVLPPVEHEPPTED